MSDEDNLIRCLFAAFVLQGLMVNRSSDEIDNDRFILFVTEAAFDIADAMMEIKDASTRH